jgi:uncharacterized protein (TIGR02118 family)
MAAGRIREQDGKPSKDMTSQGVTLRRPIIEARAARRTLQSAASPRKAGVDQAGAGTCRFGVSFRISRLACVPQDDEGSRPMITLNVLYPNKDGAKFDMSYYLTSHIPMLKRVLGSALRGCIVEQGLGGRDPGTKAEFAVLCHLRFGSVESFQQAIGPVAEQIRDDVANYASEAPIIQISDVKVAS